MKIKTITNFLFILLISPINLIFAYGAYWDIGLENRDYLDIIIDKTHAYTYLHYTDTSGRTHSTYSSLMPKADATRKNLEGIDRFPVILDCILLGPDQDFSIDEIPETLSFKELLSAFLFSIYYLCSNFIETADPGKVVGDKPKAKEIQIRRRFYLMPEQTRKARAVINQNFVESAKGNILYDALKYNCVDYVKDIYTNIGLEETYGEFLDQFESCNCTLKGNKKENSSFSILKIYDAHNSGDIGPLTVAKAIWNGIRMVSLKSEEIK